MSTYSRVNTGEVTLFQGAEDVFSNFFPCSILVFGKWYRSSEHAYQGRKAWAAGDRETEACIVRAATAAGAKFEAKKLRRLHARWGQNKVPVMRNILQAKSHTVPLFRETLLKAHPVISEAVAGDQFWGSGLDKRNTLSTPQSLWPGRNIMGDSLHGVKG